MANKKITSEIFKPGTETKNPSLETRKQEMIERLRRDARIVNLVRDNIEAVPANITHAELKTKLANLQADVLKQLPSDTAKKLRQLLQAEKTAQKITRAYADLTGYDDLELTNPEDPSQPQDDFDQSEDAENLFSPEAQKKVLLLEQAFKAEREKIKALEGNHEVELLKTIEDLSKDLVAKHLAVRKLEKGGVKKVINEIRKHKRDTTTQPKKILGFELSAKQDYALNGRDIIDIEYGAFDATVTINEPAYIQHINNPDRPSNGLHIANTPLCLIRQRREDSEEMEETKRHERVHTLTDIPIHIDSLEHLKKKITELTNYTNNPNTLDVLVESVAHQIRRYNPVKKVIDAQHYEVLGALEQAEREGFVPAIYEKSLNSEKDAYFYKTTSIYRTAGSDIRDIVKKIENCIPRITDQPTQTALIDYVEMLKNRFVDMAKQLRLAHGIAQELPDPEQARNWLHTSCLLLKPTQFRHLRLLLGLEFGVELVQRAEAIHLSQEIALGVDADWIKHFQTVTAHFEKDPMELDTFNTDMTEWVENIDDPTAEFIEPAEVYSFSAYLQIKKELLKRAELCPWVTELLSKISFMCLFKALERDIAQGFNNIAQIYPDLDQTDKEHILFYFDSAFEDGEMPDLLFDRFPNKNGAEILQTLNHAFLHQIGIYDQIKESLEQPKQLETT